MLRLSLAAPRRLGVGTAPLAALLLLGLAGCDRGADPVPPTYTLAIRAGDEQSAQAGSRVAIPLQVVVTSTAADPVPGVVVQFRVLPGSNAVLDDSVSVSGLGGIASAGLRMGLEHPDTAQVRAFVKGQEERGVAFTVVSTPPPTITGVTPSSLGAGDTVAVAGRYFNTELAGNTVSFGAARGRIIAAFGDTLLRVVVPPCVAAGPVDVRLEVGSAVATFAGATYEAGPTVVGPLEGVVLSGTELGDCLQLPAGGARYLLVPQLASAGETATSASWVVSSNAAAPLAAPVPTLVEAAGAENQAQLALDMRMRRLERELAPRTAQDAAEIRAEGPAQLEALELGSKRTFSVLSSLTGDITFKKNTGVLKYVGTKMLLYYDELAPGAAAGGFSDAQLHDFGKLFDETMHEVGVRYFGSESDIDANGRVIVLMSSVVNSLTERNCSQGAVIGFFYPNDFTRNTGSNRGEILYTLVPDPTGKFDCAHTLAEVQTLTPSTMLHEFQHMISHNQHVLARRGAAEDVWLNEGLSILAEEMGSRYYEDKCGPTGCRTSPTQLFPDSSSGFIVHVLENAYDYMRQPTASSVTTFKDFGTLLERGGAWLFVRWLADQKGEQILPRLVQTSRTGLANVEFASGESFPSLFGDFGIALYADSLPGVPRAAVPSRYRFQTRNLRALFARLNAIGRVPTPFPITFPASRQLGLPGSVQGTVIQGSMDFLSMQTPADAAAATLRFAPQAGGTFPSAVRAQIGIFRLP